MWARNSRTQSHCHALNRSVDSATREGSLRVMSPDSNERLARVSIFLLGEGFRKFSVEHQVLIDTDTPNVRVFEEYYRSFSAEIRAAVESWKGSGLLPSLPPEQERFFSARCTAAGML